MSSFLCILKEQAEDLDYIISLKETHDDCLEYCSNNGFCNNRRCKCLTSYEGDQCNFKVEILGLGDNLNIKIDSGDYAFFKISSESCIERTLTLLVQYNLLLDLITTEGEGGDIFILQANENNTIPTNSDYSITYSIRRAFQIALPEGYSRLNKSLDLYIGLRARDDEGWRVEASASITGQGFSIIIRNIIIIIVVVSGIVSMVLLLVFVIKCILLLMRSDSWIKIFKT